MRERPTVPAFSQLSPNHEELLRLAACREIADGLSISDEKPNERRSVTHYSRGGLKQTNSSPAKVICIDSAGGAPAAYPGRWTRARRVTSGPVVTRYTLAQTRDARDRHAYYRRVRTAL